MEGQGQIADIALSDNPHYTPVTTRQAKDYKASEANAKALVTPDQTGFKGGRRMTKQRTGTQKRRTNKTTPRKRRKNKTRQTNKTTPKNRRTNKTTRMRRRMRT